MNEVWLKAREFLQGRKMAYLKVFNKEGPYAQKVLEDLANFCRANETTFHPDPHIRCQLDGRREVWLRIQHHIKLNDEELWKLYSKAKEVK